MMPSIAPAQKTRFLGFQTDHLDKIFKYGSSRPLFAMYRIVLAHHCVHTLTPLSLFTYEEQHFRLMFVVGFCDTAIDTYFTLSREVLSVREREREREASFQKAASVTGLGRLQETSSRERYRYQRAVSLLTTLDKTD